MQCDMKNEMGYIIVQVNAKTAKEYYREELVEKEYNRMQGDTKKCREYNRLKVNATNAKGIKKRAANNARGYNRVQGDAKSTRGYNRVQGDAKSTRGYNRVQGDTTECKCIKFEKGNYVSTEQYGSRQ